MGVLLEGDSYDIGPCSTPPDHEVDPLMLRTLLESLEHCKPKASSPCPTQFLEEGSYKYRTNTHSISPLWGLEGLQPRSSATPCLLWQSGSGLFRVSTVPWEPLAPPTHQAFCAKAGVFRASRTGPNSQDDSGGHLALGKHVAGCQPSF